MITIPCEKFIAKQTGKPIGAEVSTTQDGQTTQKSVQKKFGETIGTTASKIVELMRANPDISISEIAVEVHTSECNIEKHTSNLQKNGIIRRVGPDKGGHWEFL